MDLRNQALDTIRPELGLRRFVTPMTGYYFWSPYRSNLINIESLSRTGSEQGAEGIEAYCTHDEAFDNHQRLLADCSWNRRRGQRLSLLGKRSMRVMSLVMLGNQGYRLCKPLTR